MRYGSFMQLQIANISKAYFVGVGGIGVSAIMRYFAKQGITLVGSDIVLPRAGYLPEGTYYEGPHRDHVPADSSVLIYSPAVPETNVERVRAREIGIPELSYPEALALVTHPHPTMAISGTHGKSTTTALAGKLFESGKLDATVIVGADVPGWDNNFHEGKGDMFIVEACEYRRHMMHLSPQAIVLTNLELDHPDYYHDLADIKQAFREYIGKLSGEDLLIINNDDANIRDITRDFDAIIVRFGVGGGADLVAKNIKQLEMEQQFDLEWKGTTIGTFTTHLPGLYNIYNILAATAPYLAYGGPQQAIQGVLSAFYGVGRRFEVLGEREGTIIVSDYAHHPTALRAVYDAASARYAGKNILTVFRPHHRERTIKLFDQFIETFLAIPHTILIEIYDVAGREEETPISSRDVITKVLEHDPRKDILFAKDMKDAEEKVKSMAHLFDVILIVGAGDADQLAKKMITTNA